MSGRGENETQTYERRVVMEDPKGMHARPAMLLIAHLRRAAPGTRFGLWRDGRLEDFGEAAKVGPLALCNRADVGGGEEVLALASGPDAGYVLDAVAEVFARRSAEHLADWLDVARVLGPGETQALIREMWEAVR